MAKRVLKLSCTADDMRPFAEAAVFDPPVHKRSPSERLEMLAELDAAFFLLYSISREDVAYILTTFQAHRPSPDEPELFVRGAPILDAYDRLASG